MKRYQEGDAVRVLPFDEIDREAYKNVDGSNDEGYYGISSDLINDISARYEVLYVRIAEECVRSPDLIEGSILPQFAYKLRTEDGEPAPFWWIDNMLAPVSDLSAESVSSPEAADGLFGFLLGKEDSSC